MIQVDSGSTVNKIPKRCIEGNHVDTYLHANQRMSMITINRDNLKQVATVASTPVLDSFGNLCCDELFMLFSVAYFKTNNSVKQVVSATHRDNVALREPLKIELNKLQAMNVIAQVKEPNDWVSNVRSRRLE